MSGPETPDTRAKLRRLAAFLPAFESPGFQFGEWVSPQRNSDGVITLGYFRLGNTAESLIQAAYESHWLKTGFDWSVWMKSDRARQLMQRPAGIRDATADELFSMLTAVIRGNRYSEGALAGAYESGLLVAILRRAGALAAIESEASVTPDPDP
jgi:hypothetical protein